MDSGFGAFFKHTCCHEMALLALRDAAGQTLLHSRADHPRLLWKQNTTPEPETRGQTTTFPFPSTSLSALGVSMLLAEGSRFCF